MSNFTDHGSAPEPSKFDKFFGQHFKSLVVGILILILIISFTIIYCIKTTIESEVVTLFSASIMGLIGFFAGSQSNNG